MSLLYLYLNFVSGNGKTETYPCNLEIGDIGYLQGNPIKIHL